MAEKNRQEKLKEITNGIADGIKSVFTSEKFKDYLKTMSKFHKYSVNNITLIFMQRPDASRVAGYRDWGRKFGRHVKAGEKGIKIIAPTPVKKKQEKIYPDTNLPMRDRDGNIIMDEQETIIPFYKIVTVFDVSQTEGKPLPSLASDLTGDVQEYEIFIEALRRSSPVPITFEPMAETTDGYFRPSEQRIAIREGMSQVQTVSAAIHEIAHSKLHNNNIQQSEPLKDGEKKPPKDKRTMETEAEAVSYTVCQYFSIETGENSFGYLASWARNKELPELRASLTTIRAASNELINDIDRHFAEICEEKGKSDIELETEISHQIPSEGESVHLDSLEHQDERETAFLNQSGDYFAIYQLKDGDETRDIRFEPLDYVKAVGQAVDRSNYNLVYTSMLTDAHDLDSTLNKIYDQFNINQPLDYQGRSVSMSDIIALKLAGVISCHYVDRYGFSQVSDFLPLNLGTAVHHEKRQEKTYKENPSVMRQIKQKAKAESQKPKRKRSMER